MASSAILYTFGYMMNAIVHASNGDASGFPKENVLDYNPDTIWRGSAVPPVIDIDLGTARSVQYLYAFYKNYAEVPGPDLSIFRIYYSDNGSSWTLAEDFLNEFDQAPHRLFDIGSSLSHRYWRIQFPDLTGGPNIDIAIIACLKKWTVAVGNSYPENDTTIYHNEIYQAGGGRQYARAINTLPQIIIPRTYKFVTEANMTALQGAFDDSRGSMLPLLLQEGTTNSDIRLVRFSSDQLAKNEIDYQIYNPSIVFNQIPYIDSGHSY